MIRFLLNQEEVALRGLPADLTVLEYVREHRRKCGTKEGCASGDCGACTVVVAVVEHGALVYRAINSCIVFVGALHAKQLLTVEDLADDGALHPVQQAMVEQHGSQCGFCTPGFIMSLFALYKNSDENSAGVTRATVEKYLGGNLCRCTGYRPIVDAALQATRQSTGAVGLDQFSRQATDCIARLNAIADDDNNNDAREGGAPQNGGANDNETNKTNETKGTETRFHRPRTAEQVADLLQRHPQARLLGGGTDLALEVTQQLRSLDRLIFLGEVAELNEIHAREDGLEIGAAVSLADCGALLISEYPDLGELLHRFGSLQIRQQATIGGNLANASPIADLPPVLIALDARLTLQQGGQRALATREMAIEDYFLGYKKTALARGEFIRSVRLPRAQQGYRLLVYKVSKRLDDDISAVCAAFLVAVSDQRVTALRVAFGGMAAIPKRALHCERALLGQPLDAGTLDQAAQALRADFTPISDVRASATYRMRVAQNLLQRLATELLDPSVPTRVTDHAP